MMSFAGRQERIANRLNRLFWTLKENRNFATQDRQRHHHYQLPQLPPSPTGRSSVLRQLATLAGLSGAGAAALFLSLVQSTALKFSGPPLAMFDGHT